MQLDAVDVTLSQEEIARLNAASAIFRWARRVNRSAGSAAAIAGGKPELLDLPSIPVA